MVRFFSSSIFWFYLAFELRLIPILIMILTQGNQPERLSAGSYLLVYTTAISIPYLLIIVHLNEKMILLLESQDLMLGGIRLFLLAPFLIKIPVFGLHFWLPKAHVEANTSGSILLAGLLLKLGRYGAVRVLTLLRVLKRVGWLRGVWMILTLCRGTLTIIQSDVKKIIAYRRVTHITFLVLGLISHRKFTIFGAVILSLAHGWASIGLFIGAGLLRHTAGSRIGTFVSSERNFNWFLILLGIILISNSSVPPFPSFFPELFILTSFLLRRVYSRWIFILVSLRVCYYNAYFFIWVSHKKPLSSLQRKVEMLRGVILSLLLIQSLVRLVWLCNF